MPLCAASLVLRLATGYRITTESKKAHSIGSQQSLAGEVKTPLYISLFPFVSLLSSNLFPSHVLRFCRRPAALLLIPQNTQCVIVQLLMPP